MSTETCENHLTSALLTKAGFRHAFFTRRGGVSPAPFDSLSFSTTQGDSESNVSRNLEIAGEVLGVQAERIYYLNQVHGREVLAIDGDENRQHVSNVDGDAIITHAASAAAGVRTADCMPVLLACPETGWVGAAHAGWKGCAAGIVPATARALQNAGARRLLAAIGPHISAESFEVSSEVADELLDASPDKAIVNRSGARPHVDLRRMIRSQLREVGLSDGSIDDVFGCSLLDAVRFFSFRRDGKKSGRLLSAIVGKG